MDEQTCELCGAPCQTVERSCGLDLCEPCFEGDPTERVAARGLAIKTELWTSDPQRDDAVPAQHTRVTGVVRVPVAPHASFSREGFGHTVRKWLGRKELEAGDSLFDDAIFVDSRTPEITRKLLADEGLQMVIMEAVAELRRIEFEPVEGGCQVRVHTTTSGRSVEVESTSHQRIVAIALHCVRRASGTSS